MALEEAGRSRAELARDKAALVVQLTASERENTILSEELSAFRCVLLCLLMAQMSSQICVFNLGFQPPQVREGVAGDQSVRGAATACSGGVSQRTAGDGESKPSRSL